jgi:hypothetical protein
MLQSLNLCLNLTTFLKSRDFGSKLARTIEEIVQTENTGLNILSED